MSGRRPRAGRSGRFLAGLLAVTVCPLAASAAASAQVPPPPPPGPVVGPGPPPPTVEINRTTDFPTDSQIVPSGSIRVTGARFVLRRAGVVLADTRGGPDPATAPVRTEPGDVLELYTGANATVPAYTLADVGLPTIERCTVRQATIAGQLPPRVSPSDSDTWGLEIAHGPLPNDAGRFSFDLPRALHSEDELSVKSTRIYPSRVTVTAIATRVADSAPTGRTTPPRISSRPFRRRAACGCRGAAPPRATSGARSKSAPASAQDRIEAMRRCDLRVGCLSPGRCCAPSTSRSTSGCDA